MRNHSSTPAPARPVARSLPRAGLLLSSLMALALVACGGSDDDDTSSPPLTVPATNTLTTDLVLPGFNSAIDIYQPAGATRAVVLLHGGLGNKNQIAYNFGVRLDAELPNASNVNWAWLQANKVIVVTPQGQAIDEAKVATTWSNGAMVSGQDDMAFLQTLASHLRSTYGITELYLMGHSMGAVMTNRVWCQASESYTGYAAFAGPASHLYTGSTCAPASQRPYYGIAGEQDNVLQVTGNWSAATWTLNPLLTSGPAFTDPVLLGEWAQFVARSQRLCSETPRLDAGSVSGTVESWSSCNSHLRVQHDLAVDHDLGMPEANHGTRLLDAAIGFLDSAR